MDLPGCSNHSYLDPAARFLVLLPILPLQHRSDWVSTMETAAPTDVEPPEPRWLAFAALLATAGLNAALPEALSVGPRWLLPATIVALLLPSLISHRMGSHALNQIVGTVTNALITCGLVGSLILLVVALPGKKESPIELLRSAAALWATNILVFALWYWRLDADGPRARFERGGHTEGAFLFPQMTLIVKSADSPDWRPGFVDYLFLAFNTGTAFSPTDTPVLSPWAKALTMFQSVIALTTVAVLVSRAVNIL